MGRRKIEIKAIKDDRNRSVTFLKRKGGLFKKAHELSVLCSVDVAVIIFGSNKKLYEYSSNDMRDLIGRYTYHGGPNEHKGPADFNGGGDDGSDDDVDGTPPTSQNETLETHMMPPHYPGQAPPQFPQFRHSTPSASPPIPNGVSFAQHAAATQAIQRGHTPQPPQGGSRPTSRNDMRRMSQQNGPPPQGHQANGYAFIPHPAIYNPQAQQNLTPNISQHGPQYPYAPPPTTHAGPQIQQYVDERPASLPPSFPTHGTQAGSLPPPPQPLQQRHSVSPPQIHSQQLPHSQASLQNTPPQPPSLLPPPPQQHRPQQEQPSPPQPSQTQPQIQEPQPPTPVEPKTDASHDWPEVKKLPQRKQYSIFTPIDESRSILSQHLAAFRGESMKSDASGSNSGSNANGASNRLSIDSGNGASRTSTTSSPPTARAGDNAAPQMPQPKSRASIPSIPESMFTPPSRQNSLRTGNGPLRPRLRVEIPPDGSEDNSATGTGGSASSPRNPSDSGQAGGRRNGEPHTGIVLPPPSPSASTLLSAGASGPPNPFARPIPPQNNNSNMHIDTPGSALPSRFMSNELLPSPSSYYHEWGFGRSSDSNTLPSPLNFQTPVVGTGPSFLRDDNMVSNKRKSPEVSAGAPSSDSADNNNEAKRAKVE